MEHLRAQDRARIDSLLYFDDTVLALVTQHFSRTSKTYRALRATCSRFWHLLSARPISAINIVGALAGAIIARDVTLVRDILARKPRTFWGLSPVFLNKYIIQRDNTFVILREIETIISEINCITRCITCMINKRQLMTHINTYHREDYRDWIQYFIENDRMQHSEIQVAMTTNVTPREIDLYDTIRIFARDYDDHDYHALLGRMSFNELKVYLDRTMKCQLPFTHEFWYYLARVANRDQLCSIMRIKHLNINPIDCIYLGTSLIDQGRESEIDSVFASRGLGRIDFTGYRMQDIFAHCMHIVTCSRYKYLFITSNMIEMIGFQCAIQIKGCESYSQYQNPTIFDCDIQISDLYRVVDDILDHSDTHEIALAIIWIIWRGIETYHSSIVFSGPQSLNDDILQYRGSRAMLMLKYISRYVCKNQLSSALIHCYKSKEDQKFSKIRHITNRTDMGRNNVQVILNVQKILRRANPSCPIAAFLERYYTDLGYMGRDLPSSCGCKRCAL